MSIYILKFEEINLNDVSKVGGKNSSLGEMFQKLKDKGICVPDGFATTAFAYRDFLIKNDIEDKLQQILSRLDTNHFSNLESIGEEARQLILDAVLPEVFANKIVHEYKELSQKYKGAIQLAIRSSATAEDLPNASFAGQHDSFLNISGEEHLLQAIIKCYASLYNDRAIKYRHDNGFDHSKVSISVGVQKMVRSDKGSAGVCFTIDPESGYDKIILLSGSWGLGENVVQGAVNPDEFYVFKPTLLADKKAIISKKLGAKSKTMIYGDFDSAGQSVLNIDTPEDKTRIFILSDEEIIKLSRWALAIEEHYDRPMDIEWAKDGLTGELFIVQARPETGFGKNKRSLTIKQFRLIKEGELVVQGKGIGNKITSGTARILESSKDSHLLQEGEILVTDITNPDWDPIMKKAGAIVTNRGGRTSHAAIVAREIGAVAIVGTGNATELIKDGDEITVCCQDGVNGIVYKGKLQWEELDVDYKELSMPETEAKLILADPDKAFRLAQYPNNGVGLLRLEFAISNSIKIHPMALARFDQVTDPQVKAEIEKLTFQYQDKKSYFTDKLSQAIGTIAAAFWPKEVIVRMSDFKTNEYANLIGGAVFEPVEENPMIGFRGASRYYNPAYEEGFALECQTMKIVREEMGFTNVKLMIPFCRTVDEGVKVLQTMEKYGLSRGRNQLEVYMMVEIPSNVILAAEFAGIFDGFSIGSNDLTQLTLGLDRDSSVISNLFNERNPAVKQMISMVIRTARNTNTPIGLCGQAPSDFPDFAEFLIAEGINSISFNPDALISGINHMVQAERLVKDKNKVTH